MEEEHDEILKARYGSFLILPLKYDCDPRELEHVLQFAPARKPETMDLTESVKSMLTLDDTVYIGSCRPICREKLVKRLFAGIPEEDCGEFCAGTESQTYRFDFTDSWLWIFNTQVAFLCLGITFDCMEALDVICRPGYAENPSVFYQIGADGTAHPFSLETLLTDFCAGLLLQNFFNQGRLFLESFVYTLALLPERFPSLDVMRQITFNLHQMFPIETPAEDHSEEDVRYVYAVKDQALGSYRWGCCVSSQTISYVVADAELNLDAGMQAQAADGLPVVLLALYEKYTCLRFTELMMQLGRKQPKRMRALKTMMLEFQAYGTVTPANLSRWHNVKQIYTDLLSVNEIPYAISDITNKLNVLSEHQRAVESARNETITSLITIFGIVSILASVLSILQVLSGGDSVAWATTILTAVALLAVTGIAMITRK